MNFFNPFSTKQNPYYYAIVTAIVIGILTSIYLLVIVPNNEKIEDANNQIVFKGIEVQLKSFLDDKLKEISPGKRDTIINTHNGLNSDFVYIDKIEIDSKVDVDTIKKEIHVRRNIFFKEIGKDEILVKIPDTVKFDLNEFVKRINASSNFNSFFISQVTRSNNKEICLQKNILISKNVALADEDSLRLNVRNSGKVLLEKSAKRYYSGQVKMPDTDFTLFVAAGISASHFQSNVQYIKPNLLIFCLLFVGILFLSICFIKPIVSSNKERLSQKDLIMVTFATGTLVALLVIYGMADFWKSSITERNKNDLKQLVEHIDISFKNQIDTLESWKGNRIDMTFKNKVSKLFTTRQISSGESYLSEPFRKLYLDDGINVSLVNGDSSVVRDSFTNDKHIHILNTKSFNKKDSLKYINSVDSYFWMDKEGLLTASISKDNISFARKYNDRKYFKLLQDKEINSVLTGVFSRESDEYQWIFVEDDVKKKRLTATSKTAIKGIAFRELFSKEIKLPPDTDYMLVDRNGYVLMQNNPNKNLYPNLLLATRNNLILSSVLSGCNIENFRMDYQGYSYQVYAKKLNVVTDVPVYILGMRNLSYLDYLSLFSFSNSFLITVLYGFLIVVQILVYSSFFYSGRLRFFSRNHFYHLFPDNSRKEEYRYLFFLNIILFSTAIFFFFLNPPIASVYFSFLVGINIAFVNVIVLNVRYVKFKPFFIKFCLFVAILGFAIPLLSFYYNQMYLSFVLLISSHIGLILYYRDWRSSDQMDEENVISEAISKNNGVQRKAYLKFLTSGLVNHFVLFPFVLVCAFYSNEINDYARYYCSPSQPKSIVYKHKIINAYGCDCKPQEIWKIGKNNEGVIHKLNIGFERPTLGEVHNYTLNRLDKNNYIKTNSIFFNDGLSIFYFILGFGLIVMLGYSIFNYYTNRFFFYGLMQASYERYYPCKKSDLASEHVFITMVNDDDIKKMIQKDVIDVSSVKVENSLSKNCRDRSEELEKLFDKDKHQEILPSMKMEFILNSNLRQYDSLYGKIWDSLSDKKNNDENESDTYSDKQNVLYDFAQDHFVNHKNIDILMELLDLGLVDHDAITGRLKVVSYNFRAYILSKKNKDSKFVKQFEEESKNGTYGKFKLPILIIAISLLLLLMYLNKESYDKIAILGGGIVTVLGLINKFLDIGKS